MSKIEEAREFINELSDIEELIFDSSQRLKRGDVLIGEAKKQISGLERNCKITKLDSSYLKDNPYIKNIHIEDWFLGNIYLSNYAQYEDYKVYTYEMRKRDPLTLTTKYSFCYFKETLNYPSIGTIIPETKWMGVEPPEISSFDSFIKEAHGNVLLMGCGLGYVAYMLSLKNDVNKVTIVELDKNIKAMFETYLRPQMNSKISIIEGDALEFLDVEDLSKYDYCSVDIWHGAAEMYQIYLKCLLLEQKHKNTHFHYWLEEDLHAILETIWIRLIRKRLNHDRIKENFPLFMDTLKDANIESIEGIREFILAPKREIISEWAVKNPNLAKKEKALTYIWDHTL